MTDSARLVYGVHPVLNAVRSGRARRVLLPQTSPQQSHLRDSLRKKKIELVVLPKHQFSARFGELAHQGMVAECAPLKIHGPSALPTDAIPPTKDGDYPMYVMLDSVTDPQNFGACLRCAVAFGSQGVIFAQDNSAEINALCCKASAGMIEWARLIRVTNLSRILVQMKKQGFWVMATDSETGETPESLDLARPLILLLGAEGKGIRPNLLKKSDLRCHIPLRPPAESLNVATAAAICMSTIRSQQSRQ